MTEKKRDKCEICGGELTYAILPEEYRDLECEFCSKQFKANTFCKEGHYICDECHSKKAIEVIDEMCETTTIRDPFELADKIMNHPKFNMYGPEHHVLTPAVILTSLKNNDVSKPNGEKITLFDIKEAIRRASKIPGGWCGFYGSCGAGMGSGIAISIFTGATPSTDQERTLANQITARSLSRIADGLEHCCKRSVKLSICETLDFLKEKFEVQLNYSEKRCRYSGKNDKCEEDECPFY